MAGQMSWLAPFGGDEQKILHLRESANHPWRPYTSFPQYKVPDLQIPGASKGWTTYQKMMKVGWALIPSDQARPAAPGLDRLSA